jgi:phage gp29-like protein
VRNIGSDGAGVVPENMTIDFIEAETGKVTDFLDAIEYWERKQSMAILGGTLTSQADGKTSTNALGAIHNEVRREIMLDDVRQIEPTLNAQLIQPIVLFNGLFAADRLPKFKFDTEETIDQEKMVAVLAQAAAIGMEIDLEYAHKITQIPRAEEGKPILGNKPVTKDAKAAKDAELVRLAALAKLGETQDITDAYAAQLAKLCASDETALIQNMNVLLGEHGDFESALAAMEQLAIAANTKDWADKLAKGMAAANLAGRSDVEYGK